MKSIFLKGLEKSVLDLVRVNEPQNFRIRGQKIGFPVRWLILGSLKVKKKSCFFSWFRRFSTFWFRLSNSQGLKMSKKQKKNFLDFFSKKFFFSIFLPNHLYVKKKHKTTQQKIKHFYTSLQNQQPQKNAKWKVRNSVQLIFIVEYSNRVSTAKVFHEHRNLMKPIPLESPI